MFRLMGAAALFSGIFFIAYHAYFWYETRTPGGGKRASPAISDRTAGQTSTPGIVVALLHRVIDDQGLAGNSQGGSAPLSAGVGAVYYSPWQNLEEIDVNAIAHSRCNHLDIAAYVLTDTKLVAAIIAFAQSERQVRIYRDREQFEEEQKRRTRGIAMLRSVPNIRVRVKSSYVPMHQKAWSDGCILREGSSNFSPSGEALQDNTLTLLNDPASINNFEAAFDAMWGRSDNLVIQ